MVKVKKILSPDKIRREGDHTIVEIPGLINIPEKVKAVEIIIREIPSKRTIDQNRLLWWTYRREAEYLNSLRIGATPVTAWQLYIEDLLLYSDPVIVDIIPEALDELKRAFRVVTPLYTTAKNGKTYLRCDCRIGSSKWNKDKMMTWLDYRVGKLQELGISMDEYEEDDG